MLQIFENIWNVITSIFDFILTAFVSLANGVAFCFRIFGQGIVYMGAFGPTVVALITVIMTLFVVWLVLRILHG